MDKSDFDDHTDEELAKTWNYLETLKFSPYIESRMDLIEEILKERRVVSWDAQGQITQKDQ